MGAVLGITGFIALSVVFAATLASLRPLRREFRDVWRRLPPERRPVAVFGIAAMVLGGILGAVLLIVHPWGPDTFVWVGLAVAGAAIFFVLAGAAAQAITDVRRARRRRAGGSQP